MENRRNLFHRFFAVLTRKLCFTCAVALFTTLAASFAIPAAFFMWMTIPYVNPEGFVLNASLVVILISLMALLHLFAFGLPRLWGKKWELKDLRLLNDYVGQQRLQDIPLSDLQEITISLERLPQKNLRVAILLSMPVYILVPLSNYVRPVFSPDIALYEFYSLFNLAVTYCILTYMITDLITTDYRQQARQFLAERGAFAGARFTSTLRLKFVFIIILMLISMLVTRRLTLSPSIADDFVTVSCFILITLGFIGFMCSLIFWSIITTLREIAKMATNLGAGQRAQFISGSIDREFIDTAMGLYDASMKIVQYRDDLQAFNLTLEKRVAERTAQIDILSKTDPLTGAFNRGYLTENLPLEMKKALRYKRPFSIIMCDLDHFKKINDTYGHQAGDHVLKEFVVCMLSACRSGIDWVVRYGGEEFVIALPETDLDGARALAERIRTAFAARQIIAENNVIHVTVSCGVAGFDSDAPSDLTVDRLIQQADRCLYSAKEAGRNCVAAQKLAG